MLHLADSERVGLGQHALLAVVHISAVFVLKEHGVAALVAHHVDALLAHVAHGLDVFFAHGGDELETHFLGQVVHGIGKVEGGAAVHKHLCVGCDDFVERNVSYTTNIFHKSCLLRE